MTSNPAWAAHLGTVTRLLRAVERQEQHAFDDLADRVLSDLRSIASHRLSGERIAPLEPSDLVNEYFLRLLDQQQVEFRDRLQFFAYASRTMQQILVDLARRRRSQKRGGGRAEVTWPVHVEPEERRVAPVDILALDQALRRLADRAPRQMRVTELRYWGGLTIEETAEILRISTATVKHDWNLARTWLRRELGVL